jgi:hypothetical protein
MTGDAEAPPWLERDWLLRQLASRCVTAIRRYMDFVREGVGQPPLWDALQRQVFLGSEAFGDRMRAQLSDTDLREVPRAQTRRAPPPLERFTDTEDRHAGMVAAYRTGAYSIKEIGDAFGAHYATVSRAIRRVEMSDCKT